MERPRSSMHGKPPARVTADTELEAALVDRANRMPLGATVWVSDLLDPRKAYWSKVARPPISQERQKLLSGGRRAHRRILRLLAVAEHREVRVRRDGISGSIDLLGSVPVELKTTGRLPQVGSVRDERPAYLEQLAMYCALVDNPIGRLIVLEGGDGPPDAAMVVDLRLDSAERLLGTMRLRAERLREAWARASPSGLPGCAWAGRGCEYQEAGICDCTGQEPRAGDEIVGPAAGASENRDEADRLLAVVRARWGEPPPLVQTFHDIAYPRRAYFERLDPLESVEPGRTPSREDLWSEVTELLAAGGAREVERRFAESGEPAEGVLCYRGEPTLVKTTRAPRGRAPAELPVRQPHYLLELGLRCQALGHPTGRLILAHEPGRSWGERLEVLRVEFDPVARWRELAAERREALGRAIELRDPRVAPPCPAWMAERCPYRSFCGCGASTREFGDQR